MFALFLFLVIIVSDLKAQRSVVFSDHKEVSGWADDTHFLISSYDENNNLITESVDVKSGKEVKVPLIISETDLLNSSLPQKITLTDDDVISPDNKRVIIIQDNDLFYFAAGENELRRLTYDKLSEVNTRFSPDSKKIAYTKNKDLYVFDLIKNKEIRLTFDATGSIYNGYASWVYMEEILGRASKYAAFWWSPDGNKLAYLRTDDSDVPVFTLNRLDEPDGIHGLIEANHYPKAGDPNPKVKIGIADIESASTTWIKTDYDIDQYIAWPFWTPDSKNLAFQVVNRDQNTIKINLADPASGDYIQIYEESRKTWVEFYEDIYVMQNGSGFIVRSYRNDWENLYYHAWDGTLISRITDFNFRVTEISRVDEEAKMVYFYATGEESTDKHLFRAGLDGTNLLKLTSGEGTHDVSISPKGTYFIDTWSSIASPGSIILFDKKGKVIREVHRFASPVYDPAKSSKAEMVKILTSDGLFNMPSIIIYPLNFDPLKKYPVIFTIYGGPNSARVTNKWMGSSPSWNSQNGIITFIVDHRGSGHFGKKGQDYLYRSLGKWEILDYEDAVKWLRTLPYVDPSRMGITGGSYGGYMTCLALTKGAGYWTHGFAESSVTDFRLYDNIYTERFMDMPSENPEGYRDGSALNFTDRYTGKIYINHGDMDDNVHMQNSLYLISKLQDEGKVFEFMIYPGERHGIRGLKGTHSDNEANRFWLDNFFGK